MVVAVVVVVWVCMRRIIVALVGVVAVVLVCRQRASSLPIAVVSVTARLAVLVVAGVCVRV